MSGTLDTTLQLLEGGKNIARLDGLMSLDANVLADFLNYAVQNDHAHMVHHCKLTATNLTPGRVSFERPLRLTVLENADGERVLGGDLSEKMFVEITPTIGTELTSAQIKIDANIFNGFDQMGEPIIAFQQFESTVNLREKETFRLGTVERESEVTYRRGIPGLKEIPGLKYLFSVEGRRTERSLVHLIATPVYCNPVQFETLVTDGYDVEELKKFKQELPESILESMAAVD